MAGIDIRMGLPGSFGGMEDLENEPPVSWLLDGWLAAREMSVLYGQGGTFKSYIAIGWSLQLAAAKKDVLYIAAEGTSGLRSRVDAWMAARGKHDTILPAWNYYNANVHVDEASALATWVQGWVNHSDSPSCDLVVVDTLARNFAGDESSPKDVGAFVEGCEYLRREMQTAVLVLHHMGVSTGRERGSAALRNATFGMFKTSDPRYNDKGGGSVLLECDRMKDAPRPKDVRVQMDTVALSADEYGTVHRLSQAMRPFPPAGKQKPKKEIIDAEQ